MGRLPSAGNRQPLNHTRMLDSLAQSFEPFMSYRVVTGALFGAYFLYTLLESFFSLRDVHRTIRGSYSRYKLDVIFRKYLYYAALRIVSVRMLWRFRWELAQNLALLAMLAIAQYWFWSF